MTKYLMYVILCAYSYTKYELVMFNAVARRAASGLQRLVWNKTKTAKNTKNPIKQRRFTN